MTMTQDKHIIILKVGTTTLVNTNNDGSEALNRAAFERIARQIQRLRQDGTDIVLVSSAAITAGMIASDTSTRPSRTSAVPELQRLASIGWRIVLNEWDRALGKTVIGELMLTRSELDRATPERDEALRTIHTLLSHGDIPIINENDAIAHDDITFGDNDMLAAHLAIQVAQSELFGNHIKLVLLSDVDGLYADKDDRSSVIRVVDDIASVEHLSSDETSRHSSGGIASKLKAAELATGNGVEMLLANGASEDILVQAIGGTKGTTFLAK